MSSVENHERKIKELEEEQSKLLPRLDALMSQYKARIPAIAADWIKREVERRIEDHAEHIEKMGLEGLRTIKREMEVVVKDLPTVADQLLSDPSRWPHRHSSSASSKSPKGELPPDEAAREMISTLGPLLGRHKLLEKDRGYPSWQCTGGKWRYTINLWMDHPLPDIMSEYWAGIRRLREIEGELGLREERSCSCTGKESLGSGVVGHFCANEFFSPQRNKRRVLYSTCALLTGETRRTSPSI